MKVRVGSGKMKFTPQSILEDTPEWLVANVECVEYLEMYTVYVQVLKVCETRFRLHGS